MSHSSPNENPNQEIEIKLRVPDALSARRTILQAGFRTRRRRIFESNVVFDTDAKALRARGELLRLRRVGRAALLTYKGPALPGRHKSREEIELAIGQPDQLSLILRRLGYHSVFRYDKYRTEFANDADGVVTLDETPIGVFLELEGAPAWIDETASRLGFSESDYITESYGGLYLAYCRERGIQPTDMIF